MKIKVKQIETKNNKILINFESTLGIGTAIWKGLKPPIIETIYDIEFDIDKTFIVGKVLMFSNKTENYINIDKDEVIANGYIDSVDNDGLIYFRLAKDCLVMIETDSIKLDVGLWLSLHFTKYEIEAFAQGN